MQEALDDLVKLLDLEAIEVNIFRGRSPDENRQRVFGGQVAGQALVAAARTVDDPGRMVHSLHAYFLRPGDPNVPILYEVDRIREMGIYAEVLNTYMEEAPLIGEWETLTTQPNVIVVPFFIADGLHSYQDIPVLLGIEQDTGLAASEREIFRKNPYHIRGRTLYYASAIGTEPLFSELLLDQVALFDQRAAAGR